MTVPPANFCSIVPKSTDSAHRGTADQTRTTAGERKARKETEAITSPVSNPSSSAPTPAPAFISQRDKGWPAIGMVPGDDTPCPPANFSERETW